MKKLLWALLPLVLLISCGTPSGKGIITTTVTPQNTLEAEEYAVYNTLIEAWYISGDTHLIVIDDYTHTGLGHGSDDLDKRLEYVRENLSDLTEEVIADFKTKNKQSSPLKPLFSLKVSYGLISNQEIQEIFKDSGDGWDKFYKLYPNSQGIMTLSRVGFNTEMDKALVYVGNQSHWLAGSGHFVLFTKESGTWKVQSETMVWIS